MFVLVLPKEKERWLIEKVKGNPMLLRNIEIQTDEICLEAVKQNGDSLRYVKNQTPVICLESVKEYGHALRYVQKPTPKICLEAVKENHWALHRVRVQTEEMCLIALYNDSGIYDADSYDLDPEDIMLYEFIESPTKEMEAVNKILENHEFKSYRETRYRLANNEIGLNDSPYHVLKQLYIF